MKLTNVLLLVVTLSCAIAASAQESRFPVQGVIEWPKIELGVDYSYLRLGSSAPGTQRHNFLGGGGSLTYNWNEYLGLKGEVQGYTSDTTGFNIPPNSSFPNGLRGTAQGNLVSYLIGPQFKVRSHFAQPFAHIMAGGAHTNTYDIVIKPLCTPPLPGSCTAKAPSDNSFALDLGGGVDLHINRYISLRPVQVDYLLTRFSNAITQTSNQSSFHYSAGLVFTLGWGGY